MCNPLRGGGGGGGRGLKGNQSGPGTENASFCRPAAVTFQPWHPDDGETKPIFTPAAAS